MSGDTWHFPLQPKLLLSSTSCTFGTIGNHQKAIAQFVLYSYKFCFIHIN